MDFWVTLPCACSSGETVLGGSAASGGVADLVVLLGSVAGEAVVVGEGLEPKSIVALPSTLSVESVGICPVCLGASVEGRRSVWATPEDVVGVVSGRLRDWVGRLIARTEPETMDLGAAYVPEDAAGR